MIKIKNIKVLIPAAGKGTRSGLNYPKSLFVVKNKPILVRICEAVSFIDEWPSIIINPEFDSEFIEVLKRNGLSGELIPQNVAQGMGDAILQFENSNDYHKVKNILLIWGDIPFLQRETIERLIIEHDKNSNHFTFATKIVDSAYTLVNRDENGIVREVIETRENEKAFSNSGERDIGVFIFDKKVIFELLKEDLSGKYGSITKEHGFLYIIKHLYDKGYKVEAVPIAKDLDVISLNYLKDLDNHIE